MKSHLSVAEFFYAQRQTDMRSDMRDEAKCLFHNYAKVSTN